MNATLDLVYRYRTLMGKCDAGMGLGVEEIEEVITLESMFRAERDADNDLWAGRRAFSRNKVDLSATLRNRRLSETVGVVDLGPGGMVCRKVPFMEIGERIEVVFDNAELGVSYRFRAIVAWAKADGSVFTTGLELAGAPVMVRFGPSSARRADTVVDEADTGRETDKLDRVAA